MSDIRKSKEPEQSANLAWPMFGRVNLEVAQPFWKRSETFAKALSDWNTEITHFVAERISRGSDAMGRATRCQSLPEIFEVEAQWLRGTFDDYFGEARRLMEVNSRIAASFVEPTEPVGTPASSTKAPQVEPAEPVGTPASSTKVPQVEPAEPVGTPASSTKAPQVEPAGPVGTPASSTKAPQVEPTKPVGTPASSTKAPQVEPTKPVGTPASSTKVPQRERT